MFYEIPSSLNHEIDELENLIHKFRENQLDATALKAHRVPFGVYEQRRKNSYMVRIRCPGGALTPRQLKAIAQLSIQYGAATLHITTRQEFQLHDVSLEYVIPILRELFRNGLTTRGGGGNTVRNMTASFDSGILKDEVFDVAPYAFALTSRLISEPDSWVLPRKFKIAFSNSARDTACAAFNDLGFIATVQNGLKGFKVYVAGGLGAKSEAGHCLHRFIPDEDVYIVAEALKKLFDKHGNRKNRHAARLRFVWNKLGETGFLELYHQELESLRRDNLPPLEIKEIMEEPPHIKLNPISRNSPEFELWKKRYVTEQKQDGLYSITVSIFLGNLKNEDAIALADFLTGFGGNTLRTTPDQNLSIRNIPEVYLKNVYECVREISDFSSQPKFYGDCISCTGASTCQLGVCLSRGAMTAVMNKLMKSDLDLDSLPGFKLNISGCPNACGQHLTADLGFYGKVGRKGQRFYPLYAIVAGAIRDDGSARLAQPVDEVSARDLPDFVVKFLKCYLAKKGNFPSFASYVDREGKGDIRSLCHPCRNIPDFEEDKNYYYDWGDESVFSVVGKGIGECSAGILDLIEFDLNSIKTIRKKIETLGHGDSLENLLYQMALSASRMLLVTQGLEASSDRMVFESFSAHFIRRGLVDSKFQNIIERLLKPETPAPAREDIFALADAVEKLYAGMDNSLRFPSGIEEKLGNSKIAPTSPRLEAPVSKDYRGVACPMNFVKTKLALAALKKGQLLKILLDDGAPIQNVPRSVENEGHRIVEQTKIGDHWSVLIEKGD